jgi:hypothetical protein
VPVAWSKRRKGRGKGGRHPFIGPQWEGSGRGGMGDEDATRRREGVGPGPDRRAAS